MRLVAIYNVWDDWGMLEYSTQSIEDLVDGVVIVASEYSNYGEFSPIPEIWKASVFLREPQSKRPRESETDKRNFGLKIARELGYTHFLTMDADEFYENEPFLKAKELFHMEPSVKGIVCTCTTYFKSPKLTIGLDSTLVPFIHELTPHIRHGFNRAYPCSWHGDQILIDPTRQLNINSGVVLLRDVTMHHMSWVRKDYQKKIRNSTARANLERSTILNDLVEAKEGGFCQYYGKTLVRASVDFNIPEYEFDEGGNATIRKDL